jgi:RimJ/RimL family protein N-acetyltransferase
VPDTREAEPEFRPFTREEAPLMVEFLTQSEWPYHGERHEDPDEILQRIADGFYDRRSNRTFWIVLDAEHAGMIRLFDLDDETLMFDLRIAEAHRRRGLGHQALTWLTDYIFSSLPAVSRIEGTTRQDNEAMRRIFRACGFAKEAHYRDAWPDQDGGQHDAVGYAILRRDWATGTVTKPHWNDELGHVVDRP